MIYFIHRPDWGTHIYNTEEEFLKAVQEFDFKGDYLDDGWNEDITFVFGGTAEHENFRLNECVETHVVEMFNRVERPDDVDEEGWSEETDMWWDADWDYICDYRFKKIEEKKHEKP